MAQPRCCQPCTARFSTAPPSRTHPEVCPCPVIPEAKMCPRSMDRAEGRKYQLRDALLTGASILALEWVAARLIPCYYSLTGSQPGSAASQQQFIGPQGKEGGRGGKKRENIPSTPKTDPGLFLAAYSSHELLFKSHNRSSVQKTA